jgi:hypothetical protein
MVFDSVFGILDDHWSVCLERKTGARVKSTREKRPFKTNLGTAMRAVTVPDYTMTIIGAGIAVIIAVAIAAVAIILVGRKR